MVSSVSKKNTFDPSFMAGRLVENLPHLKAMGRRERRAAETRLRLFRCALQLFAERGFPNVTVEDITEAADVGKGTFFNYFDSKDDVLGVMAEIQLGKIRDSLEHARAGKQSIHSVLHQVFQRMAEEPARSPKLAGALLTSFLVSERIREYMYRNMAEGRRLLAQIIELGQQRREIDAALNKDQVALLLQQDLLGALLIWSLRGKPALPSTLEATFQHTWRAICVSGKE